MKSNNNNFLFLKNIIKILSTNLLVTIMGFINSFIFPKIMSLKDYALYHSFLLYLTYTAIFHLGFPDGLIIKYVGKEYSKIVKEDYKSETYFIISILSFFSILLLIIYFITNNLMILFVSFSIVPVNYLGSIKSLWQSWALFNKFSIVNTVLATFIPVLAFVYYLIKKELPGNVYISIYLLFNWFITVIILKKELDFTKNVKMAPIISKKNYEIEKIGIGFLLGNYINTLFISCDKQFVKWFFSNEEFAFYSFGISMQALMTIFITSLSQPLFPLMANIDLKDNKYIKMKNYLLIFGSFSGCAYFFASFIIKNFIIKFIPSLEIIKIYFLVFPAMAIVNCLYINLYKINNKMKTYVRTLIFILILSIIMNCIFISFIKSYTSVAIATVIIYYIWICIGSFQFNTIKYKLKDIIFILFFLINFLLITSISNDVLGCICYFMVFFLLSYLFYDMEIKFLIKFLYNKFLKLSKK